MGKKQSKRKAKKSERMLIQRGPSEKMKKAEAPSPASDKTVASKENYVVFKRVKTGYGQMEVLHGIDLTVKKGEIVSLIGANGAGKSTTLMTLSGVNRVWEGEIIFDGESLNNLQPHEIVARGICHVPEGRQIFPDLTVLENLQMGAFLRNDKEEIQADLQKCFKLFPILDERSTQLGGTLSGGEQQMLAIGRALMARPNVLLLDEPSLGLAPFIIQQIFAIVKDLNAQGTTVFIVEQNAKAALRLSHRGYVMETGKIVLSGKAEKLIEDPRVREAFLGE